MAQAIPAPAGAAPAAPPFERIIALLGEIGAENEVALAYAGRGRLNGNRGHPEASRDYLTRALAIFNRLDTAARQRPVRQVRSKAGRSGRPDGQPAQLCSSDSSTPNTSTRRRNWSTSWAMITMSWRRPSGAWT